jgi:hypothetical protein
LLPYNQNEYDKRSKELFSKVAGRDHLYIEICGECKMPFIQSLSFTSNYPFCVTCRKQAKKDQKWKNRVKELQSADFPISDSLTLTPTNRQLKDISDLTVDLIKKGN